MNNINDISADDSVVVSLWVKLPTGNTVSTDGLGQKNFETEQEAEAFKLGLEFALERLNGDMLISDVSYGRYGYVVRVATGKALETWGD